MDFDWTTFILEIINFLILVWILKRFLYRPILDVIAKRREGIEKKLTDAQRIETEANALKQKHEQEQSEWETEKEAAHARLMTELAAVRETKLAELDAKIAEETERRRVLDERYRCDFECKCEEKGIEQGAEFSAKLLSRLASPELEARLLSILLEDLHHLQTEEKHAVTETLPEQELQIKVQSAFPLDSNKKEELSSSLTEMIGKMLPIEFGINPELIAGFHINIGSWILHANLRDELKFFSGTIRHAE